LKNIKGNLENYLKLNYKPLINNCLLGQIMTTNDASTPQQSGADLPEPTPPKQKRIRRSAEESRRHILDAAEKRLATIGPEGLRLKDIAKDAGISHPTILHHFENREDLIIKLATRITTRTSQNLLDALEAPIGDSARIDTVMERLFDSMSNKGDARLLAWMLLSDMLPFKGEKETPVDEIAQLVHERQENSAGRALPYEDVEFIIQLSALAAFGDAILGQHIRTNATDNTGDTTGKTNNFRLRMAALVKHLLTKNTSTNLTDN
jgi:AcrR family transcriptional regulator